MGGSYHGSVGIRLAAFDLDGTLLNRESGISAANAAALARLQEAGIVVVAATARSWPATRRFFAGCGLAPGAIACGGADVRLATGDVVAQRPLPAAFTAFLADAADRANWTATLYTTEGTIRRESPLPEWAATPRPGLLFFERLAEANLRELLAALLQAEADDPALAALDPWREAIGLHRAVAADGSTLLTLTAAGVDKGAGLRALCAALAIDPAECLAFGDAEVDLPLFAAAGYSVAMANAEPAIQARADMVTASADEDGVALALARLFAW